MQRLARELYYMGIAEMAAKRSTCSRLQVGAIIVREDVVMATAYNGSPKGMPHCDHTYDSHSSCKLSVHAEMNAIIFAGREKARGGEMFITHAPCLACSGPILQSGIQVIHYKYGYRNNEGLDNLIIGGIGVYQTGN